MSQGKNGEPHPLGRLIVTAGICYLLYLYPLDRIYDPMFRAVWWFGAGCAALGTLKSLPQIGSGLGRVSRVLRMLRKDTVKGSAGFLTEREARHAGLHKRRKGSRFIGTLGSTPLWLWTEVHHLIIGPAGSSKTSAAIINILMGSSESALITDIKGELWEVTRHYRAKIFGHKVLKVNPKDPANSVKINPLDDIDDDIAAESPKALSRARDRMAVATRPGRRWGNQYHLLSRRTCNHRHRHLRGFGDHAEGAPEPCDGVPRAFGHDNFA